MGYWFDNRSETADQVRRIAREQVEGAAALIAEGGDFNKTVHELRRRCKKVRGLLRLVRPNFSAFAAENAYFRGYANSLSAARDAAVMVETFDFAASRSWAASVPEADRSRLREALVDNAAQRADGQDGPQLLDGFARSMTEALQRIEDWSFKGKGFSLLEPGLRDTYSRFRKDMETADRTGHGEDFHEWRKHAKYHLFHMSLFKGGAPDVLGARKEHLDRLGELLGDHHNLVVLCQTLSQSTAHPSPQILAGLELEQGILAGKAFALGRQLAAESPKQLSKRMGQFWKLLPGVD